MEELIRFLEYQGGQGDQLQNIEVFAAMGLCLFCSICIAQVYRWTHRAAGYSQSYTQSLVLMALVTTLIMIVIGSNIARAFSLVGALSIIRFRNAVKETRDVAYIFFVMAIAMACGTRFYALALAGTLANCAVLAAMHMTDFGSSLRHVERLLTIQLAPGTDPEALLTPVMDELFQKTSVISMESVRQGLFTQIVYSVCPRTDVTGSQVLEAIGRVNGNLKVTYNYSAHVDEV